MMKYGSIIAFFIGLVASCGQNTTDYIPESRPYLNEIWHRIGTIPEDELRHFDALNAEYMGKIQILSCVHCRLDEDYFGPLRSMIEDSHMQLLDRLLELGIRDPSAASLGVFKFFIIHHFPDIHRDILRFLELDKILIPPDEVRSDDDRWHNLNVNYSGDIEVWMKFYLEGTE